MTITRVGFLLVCALTALPKQALSQETFEWGGVRIEVPAGWTVAQEGEGSRRLVRFQATEAEPGVLVALDINSAAPSTRDESYRESPGLVALAFLYPVLKSMTGNNEGAGATASFGEVMLGGGPVGAAHTVMPSEDGARLATATGFALHEGTVLIFGAVISGARPGQVIEDLSHHRAIREAYGLLRSLVVNGTS